jgi:hypothetical protein
MEIKPGVRAWVQSGPFAGFHAQVIQFNGNGTALVSVDIFGRSTPTELDPGVLGSSPPGAGMSGVREPRRPLSPSDSASTFAPPPAD